MSTVKLSRNITSFELEIETISMESLYERYLRLKRELAEEPAEDVPPLDDPTIKNR